MSLEENKALVRRFVDAQSQADFRAFDQVLHAEFVDTSRNSTIHGLDEYKRRWQEEAPKWSGTFHFTIQDMVAEGDQVACTWLWRGTKDGQEKSYVGISLMRIAGGKIIANRYW